MNPDALLAEARQLLAAGNFPACVAKYEQLVRLVPEHPIPHARFSLAMRHLYERNYDTGWREYEWRWLTAQLTRPEIPRPRWDGRDLVGRSLLVHTEQGIGDAVQLVRLLPLLKSQKRAAKL